MSAVKRLSSPILGRQIGHVRPKLSAHGLSVASWSLLVVSWVFFVVVSCCLRVISSWNHNGSVVMVGALLVGGRHRRRGALSLSGIHAGKIGGSRSD